MAGRSSKLAHGSPGDAAFGGGIVASTCLLRAFEREVRTLTQVNPPRVAGSMHLCAGEEVVPMAALAGLRDDDQIVCTYRGHGWALAAGLDPEAVMAEWA